jgi:hypothetical protein
MDNDKEVAGACGTGPCAATMGLGHGAVYPARQRPEDSDRQREAGELLLSI